MNDDIKKPKKITRKPASTVKLEQQVIQLTEALKRERADSINSRNRHEQQLAEANKRAKASVVKSLLPVIDNLERSLKHVPKELEGNDFIKGVEAITRQFDKFLSDLGVSKIATVGSPFDPNFHEAISMEEGSGSQEVVSEELQSGYKLGDQVVRHAMVRVRTQ
jgi:molecular chaperone GrpE